MLVSKKFHFITITIIIYAIYIYTINNLYTKLPLHFDSNTIDERFQNVSNIFRLLFYSFLFYNIISNLCIILVLKIFQFSILLQEIHSINDQNKL